MIYPLWVYELPGREMGRSVCCGLECEGKGWGGYGYNKVTGCMV